MASGRLEASYAARYAALYRTHWWWRAREAQVARWVRRLGRERPLRTLDVGCGDGLAWPALAPWCDLVGVEPDARLVPADSPWRPRITVGAFPGVLLPDSRFDLVLMLDVLEHLEDDGRALAEVHRVLVPGGHALLTVPALPILWSAHDVANGHYRRYVRRSLLDALARGGLQPVRIRHASCWTVGPLLLRRLAFRQAGGGDSAFVRAPPEPLNALLSAFSRAERVMTDHLPVPLGSSLIALARRPS